MSDCCKDLFVTLEKYNQDSPEFGKEDVLNVVSFILSWPHRQCRCIFREQQNLARLEEQLQLLLSTVVENISELDDISDTRPDDESNETKADGDSWSLQDKEKLFLAVAKIFQLHFPLYQARKFPLLQQTVSDSSPAKYCDVNEGEIPEALLINIAHFCDKGGLTAIRDAFHDAEPSTFSFPLAHWLINIVTQLRVWFSVQAIMQFIIPLRRPVIRYLCKLTDKDLRHPDGRAMADSMWSAVKGPVESGPIFDRDSMDLAFKYFTSLTLTVRLAGLSQITNQVHMFLELFQNESLGELDSMCTELSHWLVENRIVEHVFGPNLHVELLKQSQVILNFLAQESCLTPQHLDCMWAAAQLKHASRYVHDLLTVLTKHMDMQSILYLLELVSKMLPTGHTRQSLYLASLLTRITWSAESSSDVGPSVARANSPIQTILSASSASAAVAAAIQRKFSQEAGSASHSSSRSGSLSELSGFHGEDRDLPDQSPRKFTNIPRSDVRVAVGVLRQRTNLQDLRQQFSSEEGVYSVDQDKGDDVNIDSTSCTNSHGSSFSERRDLDDFEGEDIEDELTQLKAVAALRSVQGESDNQMNVTFDLSTVCDEGKTLLWDLVQDHNAIHLEDGLIQEAERLLYQLICYSGEKKIRMRFIEGCVSNLANNKSVVMSLRLIPKLLGSFQQFLNIQDSGPHWVTSWANRELNMMSLFFKNLKQYVESDSGSKTSSDALYSHNDEVKTRLQFLSSIYSNELSPLDFRLSWEQVDVLWSCLVCDFCCSDEALDWFVQQARSKDLHALDVDTLKYIFAEKLPTLTPEQFSMTALLLLQQLYKLFRYTITKSQHSSTKVCGLDQLWNVALKARHSKVSQEAIGYLNSLYINADGGNLKFEEEFIQRCMRSISEASQQLSKDQGYNLLIMERGLLLLKSHIEAFKKRFAFHLHLWSLEGCGITSHQQKPVRSSEKNYPIRVLCQPAGLSDKGTFEMNSTDLVADLRAEVTYWCKKLQEKLQVEQQQSDTTSQHSLLSPISHQLHPPFRLISQGHELTPDLDEKCLADVGFKDLQLVFVSVGAARREHYQDGSQVPSSALPTPERSCTPMILLLQERYFEQLFAFLELLDHLKVEPSKPLDVETSEEMDCTENVTGGEGSQKPCKEKETRTALCVESVSSKVLQTGEKWRTWRAQDVQVQSLCHLIWDLLTLLLTNPTILSNLKYFGQTSNEGKSPSNDSSDTSEGGNTSTVNWNLLLDSQFLHKLLYSLQIIDLIKTSAKEMNSNSSDDPMSSDSDFSDLDDDEDTKQEMTRSPSWGKQFILNGGLKHLCDILMSGCLEVKDDIPWTFWQQECLACLLKLICEFGTMKMDSEEDENENEEVFESSVMQQRQLNIQRRDGEFRVRYKSTDKEETIFIKCLSQHMISMINVECLLDKLLSISYEATLPVHGVAGKATKGSQVVHHAVSLLVSWAYTDTRVSKALLHQKNFKLWLQQLVLLAQEGSVRFEASRGLYRLSLIKENSCLTELMNALLDSLPLAQSLRMRERADRPNEPCAREYFSILCRLVDGLPTKTAEEEGHGVDLNCLAELLAKYISSHKAKQSSGHEEEGLNGLLKLCTAVMRHDPDFKYSPAGLEFLTQVFHCCLFDMPSDCADKNNVPWCKSKSARNAAFDLLLEMCRSFDKNFCELQSLLIQQHSSDSATAHHSSYGWHYWPHDNGRSPFGLIGIINLGATCYMASCIQQLYMMPQARAAILNAEITGEGRYDALLRELQRMFCFLLESERKAYNPRSFCKTYTMDKQPLNTGEQKDMTEFFTDLISKMEEMSPLLKELVRELFFGVLTNNVVSLDCSHVSKTKEDFYSVRCTVADMKNLYESLDEVTIKDTLDGDNMYTCSQCGKKVRAEKRACFKVLPRILCFNTMRYTFNMVTMMKEKVNTHFSFPPHLNMAPYSEEYLMGEKIDEDPEQDPSYWYTLVGVVVHTGTAEGGHYYSFIRDRTAGEPDKWFLFNDAEVKPFDPAQIASECFGGEMMTKTYDAVTEKFMDFSFEKTHSAYMLFYERSEPGKQPMYEPPQITASKEYAEWIWKDNMQFLHDKHIFDTSYFNFMWHLCCGVSSGMGDSAEAMLSNIKLGVSFLLETLIHAKEKPLLKNWVELLMDHFEHSTAACEWFLSCMAQDDWWLQQGFIKCPVPNIRQMLARLCIHVLQIVRPSQLSLYSQSTDDEMDSEEVGSSSCITKFMKTFLGMLEQNVRSHIKNMSEFFWFVHQFAHFGDEERQFLLSIDAISSMVNFYLGVKSHDSHNESGTSTTVDDDDEVDEEDDVVPVLPDDKHHVVSLEKMITVLAILTEESRGERHLHLSKNDMAALTGAKGFPFLHQAIKDNINLRHTSNLIFSLCRFNVRLAENIVSMIMSSVQKLPPEQSQSFFKLLSMLTEAQGRPAGLPSFTSLTLARIWEAAEYNAALCIDWLTCITPKSKLAHQWVLDNMDKWVEKFLISDNSLRIRNASAYLLVALVPNSHFRQGFRSRSFSVPQKDVQFSDEAKAVLHKIYETLLGLLGRARSYCDRSLHGTTKLVSYFAVLNYCLISRQEKEMFTPHSNELWKLFHPLMSEPSIPVHPNKQALLIFWYHACIGCEENVAFITDNAHIAANIPLNYILSSDEHEVLTFNRNVLPAYYGLLRLCCEYSRAFTRQLAVHSNMKWAFENLTPRVNHYPQAVEELFKLMRLFAGKDETDLSTEEAAACAAFRKSTIVLYLNCLDGGAAWTTLISAFKILLQTEEDRLIVAVSQGILTLSDAFTTLHMMYHEATACHVTGDMTEVLTTLQTILVCCRSHMDKPEVRSSVLGWSERVEIAHKLLSLMNSYTPKDVRKSCIDVLNAMLPLYASDCTENLIGLIQQCHMKWHRAAQPALLGPYFPRRHAKVIVSTKSMPRPAHPELNMYLCPSFFEAPKGVDEVYDSLLTDYFYSYHFYVDKLLRFGFNQDTIHDAVISCSCLLAIEAIPLHFTLFSKLWMEIYQKSSDNAKYKNCIKRLCQLPEFIEYIDVLLLDERESLNLREIYSFLTCFFPRIHDQALVNQWANLVHTIEATVIAEKSVAENAGEAELSQMARRLTGELRALSLLFSVCPPHKAEISNMLLPSLETLLAVCKAHQKSRQKKLLVRKHSSESEPDAGEEKTSSSDEEEEPIKKRKRTENEQGNSPDSDNRSSPGPSEKPHTSSHHAEERAKSQPQKMPTKTPQGLLAQRPPLDCIDTLAKALESAISKVPK